MFIISIRKFDMSANGFVYLQINYKLNANTLSCILAFVQLCVTFMLQLELDFAQSTYTSRFGLRFKWKFYHMNESRWVYGIHVWFRSRVDAYEEIFKPIHYLKKNYTIPKPHKIWVSVVMCVVFNAVRLDKRTLTLCFAKCELPVV